jgi:RpiR family carbohydrate utilization transcriptional regulator
MNTKEHLVETAGNRMKTVIRALTPSLVPSEAKVAKALLEHADDIASWSAARLAAETGTSPATVIRACQSLGYTGLNEFRDALARAAKDDAAGRTGAGDEVAAALEQTVAAGIEQLQAMASILDRGEFARAVTAIGEARRLLMVTVSDLAMLGQYAVFHFALVGRTAEAPTDVITMHALAGMLEPGDVCLAVGHSGTNAITIRIGQAAAAAGATVIAVTSFARGALADLADIHLAVGTPHQENLTHSMTRIRVSQMLLIDALQNALALRIGTAQHAETMLRTVTQYTYARPDGPGPAMPG